MYRVTKTRLATSADENFARLTPDARARSALVRGTIAMIVCLWASAGVCRGLRADELVEIDLDQAADVQAALKPHVGKKAKITFTVRSFGAHNNIYLNSLKDWQSSSNLIILIPQQGKSDRGKSSWDAFHDKFERSHNVKTKQAFCELLLNRRIQVTGVLTGVTPEVSSVPKRAPVQKDFETGSAGPYHIEVTDPKSLVLLPRK